MKTMKKLLILIKIIAVLVIMVSCGNEEQPAVSTESDTETITEEVVIEPKPLFTNANELYDLLVANMSVWQVENIVSGTLIDLDFDGIPELLTAYGEYTPNNLSIYKLNDDSTMKKIKTIENLYADSDYHTEFNAIIPNGSSWIIPYRIFSDGYFEYYLSAFDFTGEEVTETVKFNSKIFNSDYSYEGYYGYEFLNAEFYIDGVECKAEQSVTDEFMIELKRLVDESDAEQALGNRGGVPWECGMIYMNPSQTIWEEQKIAFLNELLAVDRAYALFPALDTYYIWTQTDLSWYYNNNIYTELLNIAESYCGDGEYLRTDSLYYDNGGAMCKPVIYLYPEETMDINVTIDLGNDGYFTCTYPDYDLNHGWTVTANPDGTLINHADGREYSYLYWEGESDTKWDLSSGFIVKGSETAAFLQDKLAYLGLIPREYNEFIVYWLPLMQNNNYNLITFQTTMYENSASLNISPEPDNVLRVFMAYMPLENEIDIPEQTIAPFERTGFSVIEWGGTCVN